MRSGSFKDETVAIDPVDQHPIGFNVAIAPTN
jgi:hypothetical protein